MAKKAKREGNGGGPLLERKGWRAALRINALSPIAAKIKALEHAELMRFEDFDPLSANEMTLLDSGPALRSKTRAWLSESDQPMEPMGFAISTLWIGEADRALDDARRELWVESCERVERCWASPDAWAADSPEEAARLRSAAKAASEREELRESVKDKKSALANQTDGAGDRRKRL